MIHPLFASFSPFMTYVVALPYCVPSQSDALEAAHFTCIPPERAVTSRAKAKARHPYHAFLRHLLLDSLKEETVDDALRTVRKLPWQAETPLVESIVIRTIMAATRLDASRLELVASLLAGLREYHDRVAVRTIDALCENVRRALEGDAVRCGPAAGGAAAGQTGSGTLPSNAQPPTDGPAQQQAQQQASSSYQQSAYTYRRAQRALGAMRLIGELYNFKLCDSGLIFRLLYTIINTGHAIPDQQRRVAVDLTRLIANHVTAASEAEAAGMDGVALLAARLGLAYGPSAAASRAAAAGAGKRGKGLVAVAEEDDEDEEDEDGSDYDDDDNDGSSAPACHPALVGVTSVAQAVERLHLPTKPLPLPPSDPGLGGWGFHPTVPCASDPKTQVFRLRMVSDKTYRQSSSIACD